MTIDCVDLLSVEKFLIITIIIIIVVVVIIIIIIIKIIIIIRKKNQLILIPKRQNKQMRCPKLVQSFEKLNRGSMSHENMG